MKVIAIAAIQILALPVWVVRDLVQRPVKREKL